MLFAGLAGSATVAVVLVAPVAVVDGAAAEPKRLLVAAGVADVEVGAVAVF